MSNPPPTPIETVTKETSRRISRLNAIYSTALELRNFEIQNLNTRNSFILTINVGLFAYAAGKDLIVLPLFGIAVSLLQIHMAAGAKFWQEIWEMKLFAVERDLHQVYESENAGNEAYDPFVHLFTPNPERLPRPLDDYSPRELHQAYEQELKQSLVERLGTASPANYLITRKFLVGRTPIYWGMLILTFWICLFLVAVWK